MKKIRIAVIALVAVIAIIAGLTVLHITNKNRTADVFEGTDISQSVDEYIRNQSKVKAESMSNAVFLYEDTDVPFDTENEKFKKAVKEIEESFFDTVFLSSKYYSQKEESKGNTKAVIEYIKSRKLKVYLVLHNETSEKVIGEMSTICDGIYMSQGQKPTESFNSVLLKAKANMALHNKKAKLIAGVSQDIDVAKFNKRSVHGIHLICSENTDKKSFEKWDNAADIAGVDLILGFSFNKTDHGKAEADSVLRQVYEMKEMKALSMRVFSSYKEISRDKENSFSAVEKYIEKGISDSISFREIGITGYDGNAVQTTEFTGEIEIYGSDLFPFYVNGEKRSLGENGSRRWTLNYQEGENEIVISQCGKEITYKVNVSFDGELLESVTPENEMILYPREKATVLVMGYYKADITVKVGTKEYKAKPVDKSATGIVAFNAKIKMPDTRQEVESLGRITVIASYEGESMQLKGAEIKPADEKVTIQNSGGKTEEKTTAPLKIENYVPSLPGEIPQTLPPVAIPQTTIGQLQTPSVNAPSVNNNGGNNPSFSGMEMALITANYADTRPLIYNDDTYTPACSSLVKGTMDYITQESEAYSEDKGETVYFYELASGVKVLRDDVALIQRQDMGDNTINVISSTSENGTLKIKLGTTWKIPYTISFTPQSYYSQYGTKFNVTTFNATYIQITFHHTVAANGNIDVSGSNVVSGASWNVGSDKTATLYMPIRALGEYYGCSVEYDDMGYMVITIHNKPQSLAGSVILLDPGHGGKDPGALGYGGAVEECDINLAVAYYTKLALEQRGAVVYSTRGGDDSLELEQRKAIARSLKPDYFISIHSNGSENSSKIGTATYYYKPFSKKLANNIYSEMLSVFKSSLYAGQANLYDSLSDGAPYYPFSVTRLDECPSVLIETGYVTNNDECYKLIQPQNQQLLGEAIARGVEKTILY